MTNSPRRPLPYDGDLEKNLVFTLAADLVLVTVARLRRSPSLDARSET